MSHSASLSPPIPNDLSQLEEASAMNQQEKNRQKRGRAKDTREANKARAEAAAGSAPLTPANAHNPSHTSQSLSTSPSAPRLPIRPVCASELSPLAPRQTAPSGLMYTSIPLGAAQTRTPLSSVPQNYEPAYPDYSSGPSLTPQSSVPPNYRPAYSHPSDSLSPAAQAQMQEVLNFQSSDPGVDRGQIQGGEYEGSSGVSDGFVAPRKKRMTQAMNVHGTIPRLCQIARTRMVIVKLTLTHRVEVHDVLARRKPKRKRAATQGDADAEDTSERGRSRKKRSGHRQASRSVKNILGERRRIVEGSYTPVQKAVCLRNPWPSASPSGDPAADDDEFEAIIEDAWDDSVDALDLPPDDFPSKNMTPQEPSLSDPPSPFHDCGVADKLVPVCFKFLSIDDLEDPSAENIAEAEDANRQLVADLQGTFMYQDPKNTSDIATIGRHRIFQKLLNAAFFAEKGINRHTWHVNGPPTAVVCGIDRWKTGRHKTVAFDAEVYGRIHKDTMEFLEAWVAEYQNTLHPVNLAQECLRDLLTNARKLLTAPVEETPSRRGMFPIHVFSGAQ
ncbi:hypothetical protein C8R46DRAFT_1271165 [Mycena filopes]|nr:hypothetical protein C8R46DRAFT_1271165 [Mycena filopes]